MNVRPLAIPWLLAVFGGAATTHAEEQSAAAVADALFQQGRSDMKRGAYALACPKFAESHRIEASNGALLNLVLCEEKLGLVASAWSHARELFTRLSTDDERRAIAERIIARLASKVPRLKVTLSTRAPAHTTVTLDGVELGASSLGIAQPVDPGVHRLVVTAPGRPDRVDQLIVEQSRFMDWVAEPAAAPSKKPPPSARGAADSAHDPSHAPPPEPSPWLMWSAVSIGVAGVAAGTVLGIMTLNKRDEVEELCPAKTCASSSKLQEVNDAAAEGKTLQTWTIISLALGAVGLGFGTYFAAQRPPNGSRSAISVRPLAERKTQRAASFGADATWSTTF